MKGKKKAEAMETLTELNRFKDLIQPPTATQPSRLQIKAQKLLAKKRSMEEST